MTTILVLGTADWNQPIATNQHYVVRELAHEFDVIYTESLGLRTPELRIRDLRRIARRMGLGHKDESPTTRAVPARVSVRSPKVIPRHVGVARRLNQPRVQKLVKDWATQDAPRLLWTYTPVTYGLESIATAVVYHCVDLLGEVDGIPRKLIHTSERNLAHFAPTALGTSPAVVAHLEDQGFINVQSWPNVADTEVIGAARPTDLVRHPNRAVFAGNLTSTKVDFALLADLVEARIDLHLAGPIAEGGGSTKPQLQELVRAGATYHGVLAPAQLAELYWTAQVGLIPYLINDYTLGVSPLKTYEYLAAGLAVVSTPVPSVQAAPGDIFIAKNRPTFVTIASSLGTGPDDTPTQRRRALAQHHSWTERGEAARRIANDLMPRRDT